MHEATPSFTLVEGSMVSLYQTLRYLPQKDYLIISALGSRVGEIEDDPSNPTLSFPLSGQ